MPQTIDSCVLSFFSIVVELVATIVYAAAQFIGKFEFYRVNAQE